jgi:O-antigen ligase/tetratricopeptide (TPR) repeat protein
MIKKVMSVLLPLSVALFAIDSGVIVLGILLAMVGAPSGWMGGYMGSGLYVWISNFTPLINSLFLISLGWWMTRKLDDQTVEGDFYSLRRLALSIVIGLVFIPVVFAPTMLFPYIVGKAFVFRFLALILLLVYTLLALSSPVYRPRITPTIVTFGALCLAMGLSTMLSIDPYKSFFGNYERMEGYITTLMLFGMLISLVGIRIKEVEWRKIFSVHVLISLFVSGVAWLQYAGLSFFAGAPILGQCVNAVSCQTDSTLGNPIYLGIYAALSSWLIAYAIFSKKAQNYLPVLWVSLVVNVGAVILSGTRGAAIGLLLGVVVAFGTYLYVQTTRDRFFKFMGITGLIVVLLAAFIWSANTYGFAQNIPLVAKFGSANTLFARLSVWQIAVDAWKAKPIIGWGQENFIHAFNQYYNPAMYGQETYFDHPHNTYLGWLVMGGILGFIAYIAFICSAVWSVYRTYKKEEGQQGSVGLAIALGAMVTYLFHIFFVFDNLTSIMLLIFMIAYFARGVSFGSLIMPQLNRGLLKVATFSLSVLALSFLYFSWWKPVYANKLIIQGMSGKGDTVTQKILSMHSSFNKSIELNSFGTYEAVEQMGTRGLALGSLVGNVDKDAAQEIVNFNKDAKENLQKNADRPFDHKAKFAYAMYLYSLGDLAGAEKYFTQALQLAPQKQIAMLALAQVYSDQKQNDKALALFKQAVETTPIPKASVGRSAYNNLRIQYIQGLMFAGKFKEAVDVIKDLLPAASRSDFESLVAAMTNVYARQQDMKGIITTLAEAQQMDPQNVNFIVWLARALAYAGQFQASANEIAKLQVVNPQYVAQFQQELIQLANQGKQQTAQQQATPASQTQASTTTK